MSKLYTEIVDNRGRPGSLCFGDLGVGGWFESEGGVFLKIGSNAALRYSVAADSSVLVDEWRMMRTDPVRRLKARVSVSYWEDE